MALIVFQAAFFIVTIGLPMVAFALEDIVRGPRDRATDRR
jgi:hypothetical protein